MHQAFSIDILATGHPRVKNEPAIDGYISIKGLRYLVDFGQMGQELLLDIFEGGRRSVDRFRLRTALNWELGECESGDAGEISIPASPPFIDTTAISDTVPRGWKIATYHNPRPLPDRAIWKGCDVDAIPIPFSVHITEVLEPHIPKLEAFWGMWLDLDKKHRVLKFRSKEKKVRHDLDDMVSDRHRQEFRLIFLKYIQSRRLGNRSEDFMKFHKNYYRQRTEFCREKSEEAARRLNESWFIGKGHTEETLKHWHGE
ncbi:hypothetical protein F4680DRAFT_416643 [Xylaria scruposa]|nr:hypothetical protein F4680DRAFT_416643 [Xylaria scruposa]